MPDVLLTGLGFGESPRWHEGRLWFSDMGTNELSAVDTGGDREVIATIPGMPMGSGWLPEPDGRMLIVSSRDGKLLRRPRWHLPRRRRRHLVRGRAEQALRPGPRRRRGACYRGARPRLLRLYPGRRRRAHPVHRGRRVRRRCQFRAGSTANRPGSHRAGPRPRRRLAVGERAPGLASRVRAFPRLRSRSHSFPLASARPGPSAADTGCYFAPIVPAFVTVVPAWIPLRKSGHGIADR